MIPGDIVQKNVRYPLILSKMKDLRNNLERKGCYYTHSQNNTNYKGDKIK